jgi:hypothetical protein
MEKKYTKLSDLVDSTFTIKKAWGFTWKKWDAESKRMLTADRYEQGFRKVYSIETDKGNLDVGSGQLSALLEAVYRNGVADINNRSFAVKSNGKTGMDIRYYFNAVKTETPPVTKMYQEHQNKQLIEDDEYDKPVDLSGIPF